MIQWLTRLYQKNKKKILESINLRIRRQTNGGKEEWSKERTTMSNMITMKSTKMMNMDNNTIGMIK